MSKFAAEYGRQRLVARGFQHNDLGEVTLTDDEGGMYQGYRTHYKWDIGLCVRDWRYVVRIANIPKTQQHQAGGPDD